jgi:hypothetical protein
LLSEATINWLGKHHGEVVVQVERLLRGNWLHLSFVVLTVLSCRAAAAADIPRLAEECEKGKNKSCAKLAQIAKTSRDGTERLSAVKSLNDEALLANLSTSANDAAVREVAAKRIAERKQAKRIAEVGRIQDQERLAAIATTETDPAVRKAAVLNLTGQPVILEIIAKEKDEAVRAAAIGKVMDTDVLAQIAKSDSNYSARTAAAHRVSDEALLQQLLTSDPSISVRVAAAGRLERLVLARRLANDGFVIADIAPLGRKTVNGALCLVGSGVLRSVALWTASTDERRGEGVELAAIVPVSPGEGVALASGKIKMRLLGQMDVVATVALHPVVPLDLVKAGKVELDANTAQSSAGAIWVGLPSLIEKDQFNPSLGVASSEGIRIGGLYEGDGSIVIDYVRAGKEAVLFPGAASGTIHRYLGRVKLGGYTFEGGLDPAYALTFCLRDSSYVYLSGNGSVTLPSGEVVRLGATK